MSGAWLLMLVAAFALAGCGDRDEPVGGRGESEDFPRASLLLRTLQRELPRAVGPAYACTLLPSELEDRALVYVTGSAAAVQLAEEAVRRLGADAVTEVRFAPEQEPFHRLDFVRRHLRRHQPRGVLQVRFGSPLQRRCPRLQIALPPRASSNGRAERWAAAAVRRYGTQSITIMREGPPVLLRRARAR